MKLIQFPEQTVIIAEHQPEYLPLAAFQYANDPTGRIVCCWQLTWKERFRLLITGKLWHTVLDFHQPLQPQHIGLEKPFTPEDIAAVTTEKAANDRKQTFTRHLLENYGAPAREKMRHMDALNYHPNDRRRCIKVSEADYELARELGTLFIEGCRIVNDEYKTAV